MFLLYLFFEVLAAVEAIMYKYQKYLPSAQIHQLEKFCNRQILPRHLTRKIVMIRVDHKNSMCQQEYFENVH